MQPKPVPAENSDISILQADLIKAACAVRDAGHAIERMLGGLSQLGLHDVMESASAGTIYLEILTDGAYPLPIGSQGTAPITNHSPVPLAVKIGDEAPAWFGPGSIILTIPPGESASIQKTRSDAPELETQIAEWNSSIRPCVIGEICIGDRTDWQRDMGIGPDENAVPILKGWDKPINFRGKKATGFSLG